MSERGQKPNIVWITMESARSDHTSPGGYERETTPNLQRIADLPDGEWFGKGFASTRWTPASTASILTGTLLSTHTVGIHSPAVNRLPDSLQTMPELLDDLGYTSFGIGNNAYITTGTDLDRGFDRFLDPKPENLHRTVGLGGIFEYVRNIGTYGPGLSLDKRRHKMAPMTTHAVKKWMRSHRSREDPFFVYIHYNDSHYPYTPPEHFLAPFADEIGAPAERIFQHSFDVYADVFRKVTEGLPLTEEQWDSIVAAYDAELAFVDHFIGELFDYVQETVPGDTIFVITGDHGEVFGEHGWLGHHVLYAKELFHVPMVVHGLPEIQHQADEFVQHIDVTRTIAELAGVESDQFDGIDLTRDVRQFAAGQRANRENDRNSLLERDRNFETSRYRWDAVNCLWDEEFKLVSGTENEDELFELPDETENVIDDFPEVASELRRQLKTYLPRFPETDERNPADFSDEAYERLRDMGYIQ